MKTRNILTGAGTALFLAVAGPLYAQQPTAQQADSACRSLGKSAEECRGQTQPGPKDSSAASKTTPDANQPVTAKGDTLKKPRDSTMSK